MKFDTLHLESPSGCPFKFDISLSLEEKDGIKTTYFSMRESGSNDAFKTYTVVGLQQSAWLKFAHTLAKDFRLSTAPEVEPLENDKLAPPCPILTKAIDDRILYGYGDPAVLHVEGKGYYLVATSNDAPDAFPILHSQNLGSWELKGFVFERGQEPKWCAVGEQVADFWAPELHKVGDEFRLYFVGRHTGSLELCIGVATALSPEGPYFSPQEPLLKGEKIDPHLYVENGTSYLFWKEDGNGVWPALLNELLFNRPEMIDIIFNEEGDRRAISVLATLWPYTKTLLPMERFFLQNNLIEVVRHDFPGLEQKLRHLHDNLPAVEVRREIELILSTMKTTIFVQKLSEDGVSLVEEPYKVLENDQPWEAHVIEGMWVVKRLDHFFMFYAANDFSTADYGIGVAVSSSLTGTYQKMQGPFLRTSKEWLGPGHPSITSTPDGKDLLIYHAYFPDALGYKEFRAVLAMELDFHSLLQQVKGV